MSSENIEVVKQGYEAYARAGPEAFLSLIDPEFEATTSPDLSAEPDTYRGREGMRRYFDSFEDVMEEIRFEPLDFIDAGDHVIVPTRLTARGKTTGIEAEQHVVQVWTLKRGRAIRLAAFATVEEARRAIGLGNS